MSNLEIPSKPIISASESTNLPSTDPTYDLEPPNHLNEDLSQIDIPSPPTETYLNALFDGDFSLHKIDLKKAKKSLESTFETGEINNMDAAACFLAAAGAFGILQSFSFQKKSPS